MNLLLLGLLDLCRQLTKRPAKAAAKGGSRPQKSSSTSEQTPTTGLGPSVKSVIEKSSSAPEETFSEREALRVAERVIGGWRPSDAVRDSVSDDEVFSLQRILAEGILEATDVASHRSTIKLVNQVIVASALDEDPEGQEVLWLAAISESKRVEALHRLLEETDTFLLNLIIAINVLSEKADGTSLQEDLLRIREAAVTTGETLKEGLDHYGSRFTDGEGQPPQG